MTAQTTRYETTGKPEKQKTIDTCINELKNQFREIDPYSELDIAEAKGIQKAINILNHEKWLME